MESNTLKSLDFGEGIENFKVHLKVLLRAERWKAIKAMPEDSAMLKPENIKDLVKTLCTYQMGIVQGMALMLKAVGHRQSNSGVVEEGENLLRWIKSEDCAEFILELTASND